MLKNDSKWFKRIIEKYTSIDSTVLNIGSSTSDFIEKNQPYIKENIIEPLQKKNARILNVDLKKSAGVDLVGDVTDKAFIKELNAVKPDLIICANLLEQLENRTVFCQSIVQIMSSDTLLIVSVPYKFPYHADPIDTLYRPNVKSLNLAFPELAVLEADIVQCGSFFDYLHSTESTTSKLILRIKSVIRLIIPFINFKLWKDNFWNFRSISTTCVIYKLK